MIRFKITRAPEHDEFGNKNPIFNGKAWKVGEGSYYMGLATMIEARNALAKRLREQKRRKEEKEKRKAAKMADVNACHCDCEGCEDDGCNENSGGDIRHCCEYLGPENSIKYHSAEERDKSNWSSSKISGFYVWAPTGCGYEESGPFFSYLEASMWLAIRTAPIATEYEISWKNAARNYCSLIPFDCDTLRWYPRIYGGHIYTFGKRETGRNRLPYEPWVRIL